MLGDTAAGVCRDAGFQVSILVLLDHAGRLEWIADGFQVADQFRSLFSWIMLGDFVT